MEHPIVLLFMLWLVMAGLVDISANLRRKP